MMILGGIFRSVDRASAQNIENRTSTAGILALALFIGGAFGWLTYYAYGWGLSATESWLGCRASSADCQTVLAWALVPAVVSLALVLHRAVYFGDELFKSKPDITSIDNIILMVFGCLDIAFSIWAVVILLKGIRLVQDFSIARSFANILLPGGAIIGAILVFTGLYKGLSWLLS